MCAGFKTGPNLPSTKYNAKCVPAGESCEAEAVGGVVKFGDLPIKPSTLDVFLDNLPFNEDGYTCYVAANLGRLSSCIQAEVTATLPVPATIVEVPLLEIAVRFIGETVESFTQAKKDKLCDDLKNAAAYDPSLIDCQVVSVVPAGAESRMYQRRLSQASGVDVTTDLTFNVVDSTEVESANTAAQDLTSTLGNSEEVNRVLGPNTTVEKIEETKKSEVVPVNPPPPAPPAPPAAPTEPYDPVAQASSGCSPALLISWKAPGFSTTITEYLVSCDASEGAAVTKTVPADSNSVLLPVVVGRTYTCSVSSKGPSGTSTPASMAPVTYRYAAVQYI